MVLYTQPEDPLQDHNQVPDFDLMSLIQDNENNDQVMISTQQTNDVKISDDKMTSMKRVQTNVKRSPHLPIFNNGHIGSINFHVHKN